MSDQIFISYRRDDAAYVTGHINDRLCKEFGNESIFTDVDKIALGVDFRSTLDLMVAECQILLAVIGDNWLTVKNPDGQLRLQDPADFVRIEIESALQRNIPVIPLLVGGTKMPSKDDLPESLQELAFRNGTQIRPDPDFHTDIDRLIKSLKGHLEDVLVEIDADVVVDSDEQANEIIEQEPSAPRKKRLPAFVLWPLIVLGIVLVGGASWYAVIQYQEQVDAANTALAEIERVAAEAKREADADAEREADAERAADARASAEAGRKADAAAQRAADAEAGRKADAEAQSAADAETNRQADADTESETRRKADTEAEGQVNASLFINEGISLAARGAHVAAIENYDEAIRLNAEPAFVHKLRADSYRALGEYGAAIKDYDEAIQLNPENAIAYYYRSAAHYALQDFAAAERDCNEAINLGPDFASAYYDNGCRIKD